MKIQVRTVLSVMIGVGWAFLSIGVFNYPEFSGQVLLGIGGTLITISALTWMEDSK